MKYVIVFMLSIVTITANSAVMHTNRDSCIEFVKQADELFVKGASVTEVQMKTYERIHYILNNTKDLKTNQSKVEELTGLFYLWSKVDKMAIEASLPRATNAAKVYKTTPEKFIIDGYFQRCVAAGAFEAKPLTLK
ncbi:hypothetical protein LZK84_17695 [Pseudomonas aeruginosa]|nr:hypothetical protein [Pseudomonas aeruginosa]